MSEAPAISILMSVHNGAGLLRPAVESMLAQTFGAFEFVIVDDGSTDKTPRLLADIDDPRVRVLRNAENIGLTRSLNRAIEASRAPLLARMDADDLSEPTRLARQIACMEADPELAVLGTFAMEIGHHGRDIHLLDRPIEPDEIRRHALAGGNPFVHGAVMLRREAVEAVGGYDPRFRLAQDYDLWLRLLTQFKGCNIPEPLYRLRRHASALSRRSPLPQFAYAELALDASRLRMEDGTKEAADALIEMRAAEIEAGEFGPTFAGRAWREQARNWITRGFGRRAVFAALHALAAEGSNRDNLHILRKALTSPFTKRGRT